eukprot:scpid98980/ scgid23060/ 
MDETLFSQDFKPAFTSTARPARPAKPVAPAVTVIADLDGLEECEEDLLAAVNMADAQYSGMPVSEHPQQNPQAQKEQPDDGDVNMEEDWDEDALAKIAEIEQSICLGDTSPVKARSSRTGSEHRQQQQQHPNSRVTAAAAAAAANRQAHYNTSPAVTDSSSNSGAHGSVSKLKGENQVLRDRQASYERRISALQEQMHCKEETAKSRIAQGEKELLEKIEKLTTQLQFKDQDLEELRKENQNLMKKKQQQQQQ